MKTKPIPAIVMLTAGFITCIFGIVNQLELTVFIRTLLIVMIIFYVLGGIVRIILDRNLDRMADKKTEDDEQTESEDTEEQVESDGDDEK